MEELTNRDRYNGYLSNHIGNVKRAWNEILKPEMIKDFDSYTIKLISINIKSHDKSKYYDDEYVPYLNHFYPESGKRKHPDPEFDSAWLTHIHRNPHHWQHWTLIRDNGSIIGLDMPIEHICCMLCDWHSFSAKDPKSTAYQWYQDNKDKMILSSSTREIIEEMIKLFKDKPLT